MRGGREEEFFREIESRLEENRVLMSEARMPKMIASWASYLGFHAFSTLVLGSLLVTVVLYEVWHEPLMRVSKLVFFLR